MPAVLDRLRSQFTSAQDRYRALEALIETDDRDPSDVERGELDSLATQLRDIQPRINEAVELERSLTAGSCALASMPSHEGRTSSRRRHEPRAEERFRSWGEYAAALARGGVDPDVRRSVNQAMHDAEIYGDRSRALVDVTTADVPGLVPPIWITTLADTIDASRPFVSAFSSLPLPDTGMVLNYPQITQRPLVGKQTAQKTEVASRKTTVTSTNTNVVTYGGGEDISIQVIQRTDPSYLSLMLELYAEQMALTMDGDAITAALAAITTAATPVITISAAAPQLWNSVLATGIGTFLKRARMLPDTFVMDPDLWAAFAGASDPTGRPLFPNVSAFNPIGQLSFTDTNGNIRGLTTQVDPNMPSKTGVLGARVAFTSFVGGYQTMSADDPSKLGRDYAVFEFAAFASRRPDALAKVLLGA